MRYSPGHVDNRDEEKEHRTTTARATQCVYYPEVERVQPESDCARVTHPKAKVSARRTVRAPDATATAVPEGELDLEKEHGHRAKPISLHPLGFQTALKGLLAVPWPTKKKRKRRVQRS